MHCCYCRCVTPGRVGGGNGSLLYSRNTRRASVRTLGCIFYIRACTVTYTSKIKCSHESAKDVTTRGAAAVITAMGGAASALRGGVSQSSRAPLRRLCKPSEGKHFRPNNSTLFPSPSLTRSRFRKEWEGQFSSCPVFIPAGINGGETAGRLPAATQWLLHTVTSAAFVTVEPLKFHNPRASVCHRKKHAERHTRTPPPPR